MKKIKSQDLTAFSNTKRTASSEAEGEPNPSGKPETGPGHKTYSTHPAESQALVQKIHTFGYESAAHLQYLDGIAAVTGTNRR